MFNKSINDIIGSFNNLIKHHDCLYRNNDFLDIDKQRKVTKSEASKTNLKLSLIDQSTIRKVKTTTFSYVNKMLLHQLLDERQGGFSKRM